MTAISNMALPVTAPVKITFVPTDTSYDRAEKIWRALNISDNMGMVAQLAGLLQTYKDLDSATATPAAWLATHKDFSGEQCLIWPFSRNSEGYGLIWQSGTMRRVARIMCEHRHGPPPTPEHQAAHSCGNGHLGCVNQWHLDWKTPKENQADRLIHGTHTRGERSWSAKLTVADVIAIRSMKGTLGSIAAHFGVSSQIISAIQQRKRWAWL